MIFSDGSIFPNIFSQKQIKSNFSIDFSSENFKPFPKLCPNRVFRPNARKFYSEFFNLFENQAKIMQFLNFLINFCKFSRIFRCPAGGANVWTPKIQLVCKNSAKDFFDFRRPKSPREGHLFRSLKFSLLPDEDPRCTPNIQLVAIRCLSTRWIHPFSTRAFLHLLQRI